MTTCEIKDYIKLLSIRVDMFETYLIEEKNTNDANEIEEFIKKYSSYPGVKVIMIEMISMEMITFDQIKKVIHEAHVLDYIKRLVSDGNKLIASVDDKAGTNIGSIVKYMLNVN